MSFLSHTVLPGSSTLHNEGDRKGKNAPKRLRKAQSHSGLFTPLIHLVKDPVGTLSGFVGSHGEIPEGIEPVGEIEARKQLLNLHLRNAETYEEWKAAATELDTLEGNDAWKSEDESLEYDAALVAARLRQLDEAQLSCDVPKMLFLVRTALTRGLGGMGDLRLYKHSHVGTKTLIERYIESAQRTLTVLLDVSAKQGDNCPIEPRQLMEQLLLARQSFGRSALLLSGGGTFGMNHIGVVKSLWQAKLLPRIISGASAGSIVCAVLCSKTDTEIPNVLDQFCYGDLAVFEREGEEDGLMKKATRFLKYGSLFDITHLMNVMRSLLGNITFQESYNRTRRILNITVSSASVYELPRLLNYVTAPNVMIWSAVCASCSVPLIFSAASLLAKDPKTGDEVPWNPTPNAGFIDGSVDNDLPMTRLAEMFNVNHFIVSQVNPHVVPFLAQEEESLTKEIQSDITGTAGSSWVHNMANLAKGEALHRLHVLAEMGIFPNYLTKIRSVLNQRYSGDITILPAISYANFPKVLSNPTTEFMLEAMLAGEQATWPKLSQIQNHLAIELALDETIQQLRARVVFSPRRMDSNISNSSRPLSQGNETLHTSKPLVKTTRFQQEVITTPTPSPSPPRDNKMHLMMSSSHPSKPYLPTHPISSLMKPTGRSFSRGAFLETLSSSTTGGDETTTDTGEDEGELSPDTDASDLLSSPDPFSSSPPGHPQLWPSTHQLFPSASQPNTPYHPAALFDSRLNTGNERGATRPSSPELRYRRLFHSPANTPMRSTAVHPHVQRDVATSTQALSGLVPAIPQTESLPESQLNPSISIPHTDSLPEPQPPTLPSLTPSTEATRLAAEKITFQLTPDDLQQRRWHRRGSTTVPLDANIPTALPLDISGTRGMLLRKKDSNSRRGSLAPE
ncbi:patatin-domain-containing protein [Aaosphaeria arxii CBS 175.79]|uniref:Patatin-domain-containing protein n=1 Tax=Aaosphaeria arxii CBS 175.79 TaxID=1450172 RepID=A0A6A5Y9T9_9PLEO|nr:patatin-domain-containing protein [Aaosphaeria arxii CBS 175.79]KAF2022198.1 patatin-domain-containing protein [Aaosphaeria arxii CBS 175.79]